MKGKVKLRFTKVKLLKAFSGADGSRTPLSEGLTGRMSPGQSEVHRLPSFTQGEAPSLLPGGMKTADNGLCVNTDSEVSRWGLVGNL